MPAVQSLETAVTKVAIIGTAPYHRQLAPYDDHEWEIWACSPGNRRALPRVTRWFELHGVDDCKGPENADWNKDYFDWLNTQSFPVYMQEPNDLVPQCRVFPIKAWLREFGNFGRMAATSSIAYMIGFAVMERAEAVAIFGVDMADQSERYTHQKPGLWIMMELARMRGVQVLTPLSSCLAQKPPLYGYAEASRFGRKMLVREHTLQADLANASADLERALRRKEYLSGQLDAVTYVRGTFVDGEHDADLEVEETIGQVGGETVSALHPRGTSVDFSRVTITGDELNPATMPVRDIGKGVLVPESFAAGHQAAE